MKLNNMLTKGKVNGIISNLVIVNVDGPVAQNEICMITHENTKLMAEVIKFHGVQAFVQVFESTRGLQIGSEVEFAGNMLEVTLGPGILSRNYDGLQNDLDKLKGIFLKKGEYNFPLDENQMWEFKPIVEINNLVQAGSWLGEVVENWVPHKIMVPFKFPDVYKVKWIAGPGQYKINDVIALVTDENGLELQITMVQKWPVKLPVRAFKNKTRPFRIMETGIRLIDILNPIAEGGTGFIPGPFGCGKTVLQHSLSRQADADIVVIAACGERANEVVEIFTEFPELIDARTGRKLIERTTIIANTSNMPVAAREASVYTAMAIAEYYRSMGLKILLLADSTSRWAQALREMSNRMEELPGPDGYPMDLPAIISDYYSRAGFVELVNGKTGSITFIGTVSPAGGNLKEPVTESTKKTARCFYALSQQRADSKRYPAIDPIESYSKYLEYEEVKEYLSKNISSDWFDKVIKTKDVLYRGLEAQEQINILGDDGVPVDYHIRFWKSEVVDFIILQQDAFDKIDAVTPMKRQEYMLNKILAITSSEMNFNTFEEVGSWFKKVINLLKQMNYSSFESKEFNSYMEEVDQMLTEKVM